MNLRKNIAWMVCAASMAFVGQQAGAVTASDTVQAPTAFFVPSDTQVYDSPYYRGNGQDWGWTQGAIGGSFTSATLNISAFDVDASSGEVDEIYAYDNGTAVLLGTLAGASDIFSFTTFDLGANFFDDIAAGLQVSVKIDTANEGWFLTLAKSTVSVDGAPLPPPTPGVPEAATWAMFIAGFGFVGNAMRRRSSVSLSRA